MFYREEKYYKFGELLKCNIYKMNKGQKDIALDEFEVNRKVVIPLDFRLSPSENIERYFDKYKKIKIGRIKWEEEKIKIENRIKENEKKAFLLKNINDIKKLPFHKRKKKSVVCLLIWAIRRQI